MVNVNLNIYNTLRYLLYLLLLIYLSAGALGLGAMFTQNQLLLVAFSVYSASAKEIVSLLLGALIASSMGFFFATATADKQLKQERARIAIGFYYEITGIRDTLNRDWKDTNGLYHNLAMNPLIYNEDGLYYILRKDIFSLENEIVEPLLSLYQKLISLADIQINYKGGAKSAPLKHQVLGATGHDAAILVSEIKADIEKILPQLEERKNPN